MERIEQQKQAMLKALADSLGNVTQALKATGIDRKTHEQWLSEDEWYQGQINEIKATEIDFAKAMLHKAASKGDLNAIKLLMEQEKQPVQQQQAPPAIPSEESETPTSEILKATEFPAEAKAMMIHAMARNDVLGIPMAAIGMMSDPEKWADGTPLYDLSFATHAKWMEEDADYAKVILWLEKEGLKAQKQGHWASGLGMMGEDAQVWKAMLAAFDKMETAQKQPENADKSPFEGYSSQELAAILAEVKRKNLKVV